MEKQQPPIYHSAIQLARLIYGITRHFPRKAGYEEGEALRHAGVEVVKECLLANRAMRGSPERRTHQDRMADSLTLIEALVSITNEEKVCVKTKTGQRWERLISPESEVKIQTSLQSVGRQLYGWRNN